MSTIYADTKLEDRWKTIRTVRKTHYLASQLAGALLILGLGILIGSQWFGGEAYQANMFTEVLSIVVTVAILDTLNRYRSEKRSEREYQDQLVLRLGSADYMTTHIALRQLRDHGWLTGKASVVQRTNLFRAELRGADLWGGNFAHTVFEGANLQGASFRQADLTSADLRNVNLNEAHLEGANLQGANLENAYLGKSGLLQANLKGAHLLATTLKEAHIWQADLRGAYMLYANLEGAKFKDTQFDETTTLPDGKKWTPTTDLRRFGAIVEDDDLRR